MDTLVILHTFPHPLNGTSEYPRQTLGIQLDFQRLPLPEICLQREENRRGLHNNQLYTLSEGACGC